jgi:hypothetical protein
MDPIVAKMANAPLPVAGAEEVRSEVTPGGKGFRVPVGGSVGWAAGGVGDAKVGEGPAGEVGDAKVGCVCPPTPLEHVPPQSYTEQSPLPRFEQS